MYGTINNCDSKALLSAIIECSENIITLKTKNLEYIACNKIFLKTIGKDESEVLNQSIFDVIPRETAMLIENKLQDLFLHGQSVTYTFTILDGFNTGKKIKQTSTPIMKNGSVDMILSIATDITDEEDLKEQLMEKNCQFNVLLEHLPMQVYMKDVNLDYITGSKHSKDFVETGFDPYAENIQLDMDDASFVAEMEDKQVLTTKKLLIKEKKVTDVKGQSHWYKVFKAPIFNGVSEVNGLVTIAQNIDAEKQIENQKELFLATLTHDLKNPIHAQISSLQMLESGMLGELNKEQKEIINLTVESAKYMQDLLYSILTTYKYENGVIHLEKESFDIEDLLHKCLQEVSVSANEKNIEIVLTSTLSKNDRIVNADINQLRRVFSNLINNGIYYAFKDTRYKISVSKRNDKVIFDFENVSPPIPEEIQKRIFDKYVSGAQKYQKLGIGLGLYLSRKVIEAHGGCIYVKSQGTNTVFTFELPLSDVDVTACVTW